MRIHNGMLVKKTEKRHEMPINVKDLQLTSDLSTSVPQLKPKQSAKTVSNEYVSETGIYQPTDNAKAIQQMVACGLSKNNDRHFDASKGNPGRMPPPLSKRAASSFLNHEKGTPSHLKSSVFNTHHPRPAIFQHPYHQPSIFNRPSFSRNFMTICCIVME